MSSTTAPSHPASAPEATAIIDYDSHRLDECTTKWAVPMGLGEMALVDTRTVTEDGVVSLSAVLFHTGADAVFDHAPYFAVSRESFAMPQDGSLEFSVAKSRRPPTDTPGSRPPICRRNPTRSTR